MDYKKQIKQRMMKFFISEKDYVDWLSRKNFLLKDKSPQDLIDEGKEKKLYQFVTFHLDHEVWEE